jgi:hypothetical protein
MILAEHTKDAKFYSLVHSVLEAERRRENDERRGGRRHSYRCLQLIAPFFDGRLPDKSQFRQVQCVDLSANGFSYVAAEAPSCDRLIVMLSLDPFICLLANVVRCELRHQEQAIIYRVACQFSGRIEDQEHDNSATATRD